MKKLWSVVVILNLCDGYKLSDLKCTESNYALGNDFDPMDLILLESENSEHIRLNAKFKSIAKNLGFNVKNMEANGVNDTVCAARKSKNVIILLVSDFFEYNYNDIFKENLIFIEANTVAKTTQVCKLGKDTKKYNKISKYTVIESCKSDNEIVPNVRLVSKPVEDLDEIYTAILDIDHENKNEINGELLLSGIMNKSPNRVLICLTNFVDINYIKTILEKTFVEISLGYEEKDCITAISESKSSLLAVLAQRPFESEFQSSIPMIFYQSSYLLNEHTDIFPNSVIYPSSVQQMKNSIMEFLNTVMIWNKITIISDGTAYSEEFEREMVSLFDAKGVMYNVEMCVGLECDFTQALKSAWTNGTKILLVNIDKDHGKNLTRAAEVLQSSIRLSFFYWIVRDWPFESLTFNNLENVYSVYTAPKPSNRMKQAVCNHVSDQPHDASFISALVEGLVAISDSYNNLKAFEFHKATFEKAIGQSIRDKISRVQTDVYVRHSAKSTKIIMSITVRKDSVTHKNICVSLPRIPDINCLVKGNKFSKPCNNYEVIMIMLVVSVFLFMFLMLTYISNNYLQYLRPYSLL